MADEIDGALRATEFYEEVALRNQRARMTKARTGIAPYCETYGNPIPAKRLKANPQATRCIGCQEKYEREE